MSHFVYKKYMVYASGKELNEDLIVLDFFEFNIILGMNWLKNYRAIINCDEKVVTLCVQKKKSS